PTTMGDVLNIVFAGTTNPTLTTTAPGAGVWTFGNRQSVTFTSIEVLNAPPHPAQVPFLALSFDSGPPEAQVYNPSTFALIAQFFAFDPAFQGGVRTAIGDINGDGVADVIVAAGPGGGPHVKVIDGTKLNQVQANGEIADSALLASFFAYDPAFSGGVWVAAGDVNGDG